MNTTTIATNIKLLLRLRLFAIAIRRAWACWAACWVSSNMHTLLALDNFTRVRIEERYKEVNIKLFAIYAS